MKIGPEFRILHCNKKSGLIEPKLSELDGWIDFCIQSIDRHENWYCGTAFWLGAHKDADPKTRTLCRSALKRLQSGFEELCTGQKQLPSTSNADLRA